MITYDNGADDRVAYMIYLPKKIMRENLQNKLHSLKLSTGKPIYQLIDEALDYYKSKPKVKVNVYSEKLGG